MNSRRTFEIAFVGLKPGKHTFEYEVDDKFFEHYGKQDFHNCHAKVALLLEKEQAGFMRLKFDVDGSVDSYCDRCGDPLTISLWDEFSIIVKMVDDPELHNEQEEDPDIYYISRTESHLDVADWIYEFVLLSIPNQKYCETIDSNKHCNPAVLKKLKEMEDNAQRSEKENSVWKGLDQFKDKIDEE